jgi:uncharacterized repeat protein (TIGR04138 family)
MSTFNEKLAEIAQRDPRYAYEAYEFIYQALYHTQQTLGRVPDQDAPPDPSDKRFHVSGAELVRGTCSLALQEFGRMARTVFRQWGINQTEDWGHIVFNLVENELMSKTTEDTLADFQGVFDLDKALVDGFQIELERE